ncbi:serine/threonine-protein kinase [Marivita hallyeonensis]|uniref:Serine/threonine protein kinase n=1 Tax=Marivita hallyeonensis TaxID=996342 RepID=A0A1M5LR54_9RHOB|nr:serine/threonine-protein kinase [Marivita hallyeonensis]SHG67557.1 Serine/threonine protein kinase [Marivita hallyeonensis]
MGNAKQKEYEGHESYLDELAPGTELLQGQYRIVKFLNSGGFGITYLASDSLDRKVVIKECFPSSFCNRSRTIVKARSRAHSQELRSVVQLFVQEARSLAKLNHPNIVGVHQVFEDNETAYMVLDFVEGRDLLDTLEDPNHGLNAAQIKGILKDVLGAVQFIHDQDILHRDISPDNILLDADLRPVLIDFGAAREEATKKSRILSAMRVVKDGYSPQEFYVQGSAQSPSSDLYALGATFYHLISGEIPPNSQARLAAIAAGDADPYEPLVGRIKGFENKFLAAIDKSLGILPKDRVQSAEEWLDIMEGGRRKSRVVTQQVPISSAAAATAESEKRSKLVPLMGSVAVIAILAVGGLAVTGQLSMPGDAPSVSEVRTAAPAATVETEVADGSNPEVASVTETPQLAAVSETPVQETVIAQTEDVVTVAQPEEEAQIESAAADIPAAGGTLNAPEDNTVTDAATDSVVAETLVEQQPVELSRVAPTVEFVDVPQLTQIEETTETPLSAITPIAPLDIVVADALVIPPATGGETAPVLDPLDESQRQAALEQVTPEPSVEIASSESTAATIETETAAIAVEDAPISADELNTSVQTTFRVDLPFVGEDGSNVIREAAIVSPVWVRPGARVLEVNGVAVSQISDIDTLAEGIAQAGQESIALEFTVLSADETTTSTHDWTVPVLHDTALPNGTVFQTRLIDGEPRTTVKAVPSAESELQVGDEIVAYVPTSEKIGDQDSLRRILSRELAQGTEQLSFAVTRDGQMWVVSMTHAEGM